MDLVIRPAFPLILPFSDGRRLLLRHLRLQPISTGSANPSPLLVFTEYDIADDRHLLAGTFRGDQLPEVYSPGLRDFFLPVREFTGRLAGRGGPDLFNSWKHLLWDISVFPVWSCIKYYSRDDAPQGVHAGGERDHGVRERSEPQAKRDLLTNILYFIPLNFYFSLGADTLSSPT